MLSNLITGPQKQGDGQIIVQRAGTQGDTIVSELHGRYFEACLRGNLFTFGLSNTALVSQNAIATGLTATAQLVIGIYNPLGNPAVASILQLILVQSTIANTAVSPGGYMWVYSQGNGAITTGSNPLNLRTLAVGSSAMKAFAISTATTGLSNNLAVLRATGHGGLNAAGPATAIAQAQTGTFETVDGALLVPPGGVLGVMNQVSTTTVSMSVGIVWEEIPIP